MIKNIVNRSSTRQAVLKSLDANMLRARVIANNIANISTPEFKRVEVKFEDELRRALDRTKLRGTTTNSKHLAMGRKSLSELKPRAYKPVDATLPSGVNNVDIDSEMAKLAESQLMYNLGLKFVKGGFSKLNAAVKGRSLNT